MWAPDFSQLPKDQPGTAAAVLPGAIDIIGSDGKALRRLKLVSYGTFWGLDGAGPWALNGKAHAADVIAATRQFQRGAALIVDYDHATLLSEVSGAGGTAGYINPDSLTAEADGIYGTVAWTIVADTAARNKEYRFYAAHVMASRSSGSITRLIGAGLTNSAGGIDHPDSTTFAASHKAGAFPELAGLTRAIEIGAPAGSVPKRVKLLPYGTFFGRDGRGPYTLDGAQHALQVIDATRAVLGSADLLFNYDHQSEFSAVQGVGGQAKAAGWIKPATLCAGNDGLYGEVAWTPAASAAIAAQEYRYLSPHFRVGKDDRKVTRLVNVALTNSPNLDLPALASQQTGVTAFQVSAAPLLTDAELQACEMTGCSPAAFIAARDQRDEGIRMASLLSKEERSVCDSLGISYERWASDRASERNSERALAAATAELTSAELQACEMLGVSRLIFFARAASKRVLRGR